MSNTSSHSNENSDEAVDTKQVVSKAEQEDGALDEAPSAPGCGILGRYPVLSVLVFAAAGIGIGVGLSYWEPDDMDDKKMTLKWIGLIGDLFIRALKAVVLPLVFVNVVLSIIDMMTVGKAGSIGWKTIGLYLLTTVVASIVGIISVVSFKGLFEEGDFADSGPATVTLGCNAEGSFLAEMADGSVMCTTDDVGSDAIEFEIVDVSGSFVKKSSGARNDISLSDTVYDGVFRKLVTSNITESFVDGNFAAVVFFAIVFGIALSRVLEKKRSGAFSHVVELFKELDGVFITLINWIIAITPFAVLSLIIKAIGSQNDLSEAFSNVGYLVAATIIAMIVHFLIVHCGLFFLITKSNPVSYMRHLVPAQTMAFACASSAATIPVTLRCVEGSGRVPRAVSRFVVPLGATINMDGGAIYFPVSCIWLAVLNGADVTAASYILLVIISTIGSAGTAPVPSASLVLIITAYNTVFNSSGTPDGFSYILAIDWFMDRLRTTLNVTGDGVVAGMVAHLCPVEEGTDGVAAVSSEEEEAIAA